MAQKINYPTDEWVDKWLDRWMDAHPDEKVEDWDSLKEQAMDEWWDNEVDHGRPTPYDLTEEQEKVSKEATKGMARSVDAFGKEHKRERKANQDKRDIMAALYDGLLSYLTDEQHQTLQSADMVNVERQIDFLWKGVQYSVTLTAHRPPKK